MRRCCIIGTARRDGTTGTDRAGICRAEMVHRKKSRVRLPSPPTVECQKEDLNLAIVDVVDALA